MVDAKSMSASLHTMLKSELLKDDPAFDVYGSARKWVERMLDYDLPRGTVKNPGLSIVESYMLLKEGTELNKNDICLAFTLDCCFDWLQAYFATVYDIIYDSHPRRGHPGWYRIPRVGLCAANDWVLLRNHIAVKYQILKKYFREKPYYADLVDLFNEVEFLTNSGRMVDALTTLDGKKDLSNFTMSLYRRIAQYKRTYYLFYLPVACALLLSGEKLENHLDVKDILVETGIYFQAQDDYVNCFGDPKVLVQKGTDIEDFTCSWLVVKALELCNDKQRKVLYDNYGKQYPISIARVKSLYEELNLKETFNEYESKTYENLMISIEAHPSKPVQSVLKSILTKIYGRGK